MRLDPVLKGHLKNECFVMCFHGKCSFLLKKGLFAYVCTKLYNEKKGTTFRTENAFVFLPSTAYIIIPFTKLRNGEKECAFEVKLA